MTIANDERELNDNSGLTPSVWRDARRLLAFIPASHWLVISSFALAGEVIIVLLLLGYIELPSGDIVGLSVVEGLYTVVAFNFVRAPRPNPDTTEIALATSSEVVVEIRSLLSRVQGDDPESTRCAVRILRLIIEHPSDDVLELVAEYSHALTIQSQSARVDRQVDAASTLQTLILTSLFDPSQNAAGSVFYGRAQEVLGDAAAYEEAVLLSGIAAADRYTRDQSRASSVSRYVRRWVHNLLIDYVPAAVLVPLTLPLTGILAASCSLSAGKKRYPMFAVSRLGSPSSFAYIRLNASVFETNSVKMSWLGRLLTWLGLDKLPAITGVLCGELSFIGPEPLGRSYYGALYAYAVAVKGVPRDEAAKLVWSRLAVKPGLFGSSQLRAAVRGRFRRMNCLDYVIVDSRFALGGVSALWIDLVLLVVWPLVLMLRLLTYVLYHVRLPRLPESSIGAEAQRAAREDQRARRAIGGAGLLDDMRARSHFYADSALLFFGPRV